MKLQQIKISKKDSKILDLSKLIQLQPQLILVFGSKSMLADGEIYRQLIHQLPGVWLAGCSTAGEITNDGVHDDTLTLTGLHFEQVTVRVASTEVQNLEGSRGAGREIGHILQGEDLKGVCVFGPGIQINGSEIIAGMVEKLGADIPISGGLAGDSGAFVETVTVTPEGVSPRGLVAFGLYGSGVDIGYGSFGGWLPFGPARKVTRCQGNILFELDGGPALAIYRNYLGDYSKDLPASGLLFPFEMLNSDQSNAGLIRTILGIDDQVGSLTLAGDINPDGYLRLMHANIDGLVDGAEAAAHAVLERITGEQTGLSILVSCVGRKLVMGDNIDEEVDAVLDVLGKENMVTGFYSYGEISPQASNGECKLHNQTMTILWIGEKSVP
ncbi:MAG: FIST C-terminal domain-containing protein [Nitrospirae bacterium]|nr:FIST C-terminal domain-containing protein [Magnetococcales bacterium]